MGDYYLYIYKMRSVNTYHFVRYSQLIKIQRM